MNNISNLPKKMVEEILCRIPLTSIRAVRSTCRKWRSLFRDESFTKKYRFAQEAASREDGEITGITCINYELYLMSFDLRGIYKDESDDPPLFVKPKGTLISLESAYQFNIIQLCYCDGLLLCTTRDYTKLVVWNPYSGQIWWICEKDLGLWNDYALGYDKSNHKILRFKEPMGYRDKSIHEILDLNSNSWRVLDVSPDCRIEFPWWGLSLKGNMYYRGKPTRDDLLATTPDFLVCFDFTKEMYGPHLPLPFVSFYLETVILSSFREEQLAVLFQRKDINLEMEIWVTTNIEPDAVSWSKFFAIDMKPLMGFKFSRGSSFLIDEEKRIVVVFDTDCRESPFRNLVCFIGENGYFKKMDLQKQNGMFETGHRRVYGKFEIGHPRVCSYVPNSVRINQPA